MRAKGETASLYRLESGKSVNPETGLLAEESGSAVNRLPFPVCKGCRIRPKAAGMRLRVFFYRPEIPPELIHTYTYQLESNWTTYSPELSDRELSGEERVLPEDGFVRVAVSPDAGEALLEDLVQFTRPAREEKTVPGWMEQETERLLLRAAACRRENDLAILLLTDTHYSVGCTWPDTLRSLQLAADSVYPDAVAHLGDLTDGLLPDDYTRLLTMRMVSEMKGICPQLWCCVGNHDRNRFRGNPNGISAEDCARMILGREERWYKVDLPEKKLRLLFLDTFDPDAQERYGFSEKELRWLRRTLWFTPREYKVLVFSHLPPLAEIHVWSDTIRNEGPVLRSLLCFHRRRHGGVLGWIHGHNHADQVYGKLPFPVVGIGCAKLEDFREHKPEGSVTWDRAQNTASQELWDLLLVHPVSGEMDFLRFGAGEDRHTVRKAQ